jgi:hypothetical protein
MKRLRQFRLAFHDATPWVGHWRKIDTPGDSNANRLFAPTPGVSSYLQEGTAMAPPIPKDCRNGYEWAKLVKETGEWKIRTSEGGYTYGRYPDIIVAFYSKAATNEWGLAVFDHGEVTVRWFDREQERREAAYEYLVAPLIAEPRHS